MRRLARLAEAADRALTRAATLAATLGLGAVVLAFLWTVVFRYVLGRPSETSEEISIVVYLWVVMIGGGVALGLREHIAFDLAIDRVPDRAGRALAAAGSLAAGLILLVCLPVTFDYVLFLWREKTPALEIGLDRLYLCFPALQLVTGLRLLLAPVLALGAPDGPEAAP